MSTGVIFVWWIEAAVKKKATRDEIKNIIILKTSTSTRISEDQFYEWGQMTLLKRVIKRLF